MNHAMTSLERVSSTLQYREPDRVPLFLAFTTHGARELGISIEEYFSRPGNVVEGQMRLWEKYGHDCVNATFYAALEMEAWGGRVIFRDDGPAVAGEPIIKDVEQIRDLEAPRVKDTPCLHKVLRAVESLKERVGDEVPVLGLVISPFSLPVMQLGFDRYFDVLFERPDLFNKLMEVNEAFCVEWANAQLAAGVDVICYFDPVSSSTVVTREMFLKTGFEVGRRTLSRIDGNVAVLMASGRCLPIVDDVAGLGTKVVGTGVEEDLAEMKAACRGKLTVLGNLNGIEMRRWTPREAEEAVKEAIFKAAPGGGFILSDNHGEIPFQVPDEVLLAISRAARKWGRYPIV